MPLRINNVFMLIDVLCMHNDGGHHRWGRRGESGSMTCMCLCRSKDFISVWGNGVFCLKLIYIICAVIKCKMEDMLNGPERTLNLWCTTGDSTLAEALDFSYLDLNGWVLPRIRFVCKRSLDCFVLFYVIPLVDPVSPYFLLFFL